MLFKKRINNARPLMLAYYKDLEENKDYVLGRNYYEWYWSYANQIKPENVLEIGVKWGYSSIAMGLGCNSIKNLFLYDNEKKGVPLSSAVENIQKALLDTKIFPNVLDTLDIRKDSMKYEFKFDIIHIDGGHRYNEVLNDLYWTNIHLSDKGIIIMDDTKQLNGVSSKEGTYQQVNAAISDFLKRNYNWNSTYIDTYTGHTILYKKKIIKNL